jgi:hypothetical protein
MSDHLPDATKMMTVEQWVAATHREGDQSLIGVSPDALAKLIEDSARLDWMLSKVDVYSRESGWNLITKIRFHPAYDTLISIRNRKDIDQEMKLDQ